VPTPSHNPFHHPDNPGASASTAEAFRGPGGIAATRRGHTDQVEPVERIDKPWGHEEIVAVLEGRYVGKVLTITAGHSLSLHLHRHKDETLAVQTGQVSIEYGPDASQLRTVVLDPGQRLLIRAQVVHRVTALSDSRVLETSTAVPGWREDVVRLQDAYGREGTSAP
jgi:mannose-6-phosphate isomerase-like protein (cupin superfamily)